MKKGGLVYKMIDVTDERNKYLDELIAQEKEFLEKIVGEKNEIKMKIAKSQVDMEIARIQGNSYSEEEERLKALEKEYHKYVEGHKEIFKTSEQRIERLRSLKK